MPTTVISYNFCLPAETGNSSGYILYFPLLQGRSCRTSPSEFHPELFSGSPVAHLRLNHRQHLLVLFDHLSRAAARFAMDPVAGNHRQDVFDPTGSNAITIIPDWIERTHLFDLTGSNTITIPDLIEENRSDSGDIFMSTRSGFVVFDTV